VHELRAAAIGVLERNRETLVDRDLPWVMTLVRKSKSWASVDWIAPKVIGDVIARDPRGRKRLPTQGDRMGAAGGVKETA
jgi:hypothetical protein